MILIPGNNQNINIGLALPAGTANNEGFIHEHVFSIRELVQREHLRSVRQYKVFIRDAHKRGLLKEYPVEASKVFRLPWTMLLFGEGKFASYEEAIEACRKHGVDSGTKFTELDKCIKKEHKLPSEMTHYQKFPGWVAFKAQLRPSLTALRTYCHVRQIDSTAKYREFANSTEGRNLFIPENPAVVYLRNWVGWGKILFKEEKSFTIESIQEVIRKRAKKKIANEAA